VINVVTKVRPNNFHAMVFGNLHAQLKARNAKLLGGTTHPGTQKRHRLDYRFNYFGANLGRPPYSRKNQTVLLLQYEKFSCRIIPAPTHRPQAAQRPNPPAGTPGGDFRGKKTVTNAAGPAAVCDLHARHQPPLRGNFRTRPNHALAASLDQQVGAGRFPPRHVPRKENINQQPLQNLPTPGQTISSGPARQQTEEPRLEHRSTNNTVPTYV